MARAARQQAIEETEPAPEPVTETLTYIPGPSDPVQVTWGGHTFKANVPKEVRGWAAGTEREKLNAIVIESARGNRHFIVGNAKPKRDPVKDPETPEEYRGYFTEWLKSPAFSAPDTHAEDLISRFAKDRELQAACGVGSDDYEFMQALFVPKLHELAKSDELTEPQVASLWMRFGYNVTPW